MKRNWFIATVLAILAALLSLVGCGGSSGSGGGGGGVGGGFVALYATDSMDGNDHVWVKIYKVSVNSGAGAQVTFDDPAGTIVDLKTLHDGVGSKFQFLSLSKVSGGPFDSATVVMDKDLTVFAAGSKTGTAKTFDDKFDDKNGKTAVTFAFTKPLGLGTANDKLVVDFDLANWDDKGGKITPVLKGSEDANGLGDDRRHVEDDHEGTVSGLVGTSPDQEFDLVTGGGRSFHIRTNVDTVIFNSDNKPSPVLKNGARVQVRGKFLVAAGSMLAVSIKIENEEHQKGEVEVKGTAQNIDATSLTFEVQIREAERFVPTGTVVKVVTTNTTCFRDEHGVSMTAADFFAALGKSTSIKVEGTYDEKSNTITALRAKMDGQTGGGGGGGGNDEAEVKGATTELNEALGTFVVTLSEWEGFNGSAGLKLNVVTTADTKFYDKKHNVVDKTAFFASLAQFGHVEIRGKVTEGEITALTCRVEDN